jgi:hypothetical protein
MMQQEKLPGLQRIFAIWAHVWTFGDAGPQGFKMVDIKHCVGAMQTVDFC